MAYSSAYHPQSDGWKKVINRSLGNLLRCIIKDYGVTWYEVLAQGEFAYNDLVNRSTGFSPFQIVYETHPRGVMELRDANQIARKTAQVEEFLEMMMELHQEVKHRL